MCNDFSFLGKTGTTVHLQANYFQLMTQTEWKLYQYQVDFSLEEERTGVRKGLLRQQAGTLGAYIFDGSTLFTVRVLPEVRFKIKSFFLYVPYS